MTTRYFRAGVGTVVYNDARQVAFFERTQHPVGIWQFQQGGIDHGEEPATTLWRELKEEIGLSQTDIETVTEVPGWHPYQDLLASTDPSIPRIGQVHRWFFLKLKTDASIDLKNATDDEFGNWRWTTFAEAIEQTSDHKKPVYEILQNFFMTQM
jgi:putative (di)nucleoside polyphosphate hydrolase